MPWSPQEISDKLAMIRRLSAGELAGYHRYCTVWREPFPGEVLALHQRARELGVTLTSSSSAGPSA